LTSDEPSAFGSELSDEGEEAFRGELAEGVEIGVLETLDVVFKLFVVKTKSPEITGEAPSVNSLIPFSRIVAASPGNPV
jgi:hypothetical protein